MSFKRRLLILGLGMSIGAHAASVPAGQGEAPACQILDTPWQPAYWAEFSLIPDSTCVGFGETSYAETTAGCLLGYYPLPLGNLDLSLNGDFLTIFSSAGIGLPDFLASVAVNVGWTVRHASGAALRFRAAPGLYTDVTSYGSRAWNLPVTVALIQSFSPSVSGILGVEMRPYFQTPAMPLLGVEWEAAPRLRVKAQLPESRVDWYLSDWWLASVTCRWRTRWFHMEDGAGADREGVELDDVLLAGGLTYQLRDDFSVGAHLGYAFDRSVHFNRPAPTVPDHIDLESNVYLGVSVTGPF